ncbi:MAG TPA: regulatory protein RecX [Chitinophagaceae bacterium]|jgi:regulatory protein
MQKKKLTKEQALQKLRHYCRYQERCRSEVKDKLFELGVPAIEHDELLTELTDENYLDEERFAIAFTVGRFKMRQWGRKKISYELKGKRVAEGAIQKALEHVNENDYLQILRKLADEKYVSLKSDQHLIRKKKTINYLLQKGYEADLVKTLFENMN